MSEADGVQVGLGERLIRLEASVPEAAGGPPLGEQVAVRLCAGWEGAEWGIMLLGSGEVACRLYHDLRRRQGGERWDGLNLPWVAYVGVACRCR